MAASAPALTISEFLLVHVVGDGEPDNHAGPDPVVHSPQFDMSDPVGVGIAGEELRVEINRHSDRTMTVVSRSGTTWIKRCGVCPKEDAPPCTALRLLALPYAQHPAYRSEWSTIRPDVPDVEAAPHQRSDGPVSLLYQGMADLPPPGNPRRRALRELGISISRSDFSDEELAQRRIVLEQPAPPTD